jgi:predicted nuclease of predicted toxin-antitoxin system
VKLLLDQNISFRLLKNIDHLFPQSTQVKTAGMENRSDLDIWRFDRQNDFAILTFDLDFFDLNTLYGSPPKIILVRTNNQTTASIEKLILQKTDTIIQYLSDPKEIGCLMLTD